MGCAASKLRCTSQMCYISATCSLFPDLLSRHWIPGIYLSTRIQYLYREVLLGAASPFCHCSSDNQPGVQSWSSHRGARWSVRGREVLPCEIAEEAGKLKDKAGGLCVIPQKEITVPHSLGKLETRVKGVWRRGVKLGISVLCSIF